MSNENDAPIEGFGESAEVEVVTLEVIEKKKAEVLAQVPTMKAINTPEEANAVSAHRAQVKKYRKTIEEFFRPGISQANKLWKTLLANLAQFDDPAAAAEKRDNELISEYQIRIERKRQEEQAAADAKAKAEEIAKAKAEGDKKRAAAIESGKIAVVSNTVVAAAPKIEGNSTVWLYRVEVVDKLAMIKAIAAGKHPLAWVTIEEGPINGTLDRCEGQMDIAGCKVNKVPSQRGRAAK